MVASRTYGGFFEMIGGITSVFATLPRLVGTYRNRRLDPVLREKLMFVVSEVNACRACTRAHARLAIREGISTEELDQLQLPSTGDRRQRVALAYAIARAEAGINSAPGPEFERALAETFTDTERRDIEAVLCLIINANLTSNTIEARTTSSVRRKFARLLFRTRPSPTDR